MITTLFTALFASLFHVAFALSNPTQRRPNPSPPLQVWDNVIPHAYQRQLLHDFASKNGLGHACFSRPMKNREERNIIELALDAILTEIESEGSVDGSKPHYVEYWSRQEWRHIEAHADVDENLAKVHDSQAPLTEDEMYSKYPRTYHNRSGGYRYPINGHVLYLQVGSDVKGPTVVFPGHSSGGDLYGKRTNIPREEVDACSKDETIIQEEKNVQMISIPAVSGRLLRFNGEDLHAVPRPHNLWVLPFITGSADFEPEAQWGRSVILFNIWPGEEDPPLDVPLDVADDIDHDETKLSFCNKFSDWKYMPISQPRDDLEPSDPNAKQSVKVWLVGNERRRDYTMRTVPLICPLKGGQEIVSEALAEEYKVTELQLRQLQ